MIPTIFHVSQPLRWWYLEQQEDTDPPSPGDSTLLYDDGTDATADDGGALDLD